MDRLIPWAELSSVIEPFYPKAGGRSRPQVGVERMPRIHFLQIGFNLSVPAVEEARRCTILGRCVGSWASPWARSRRRTRRPSAGSATCWSATTISAPSSTKNKDRKRDPERYQTRKGNRHQALTDTERAKNRSKSRVRAKVEHPFLILKRVFGFNKLRCRGLDKNANRLFVACGLVNLYMARRRLLRVT